MEKNKINFHGKKRNKSQWEKNKIIFNGKIYNKFVM